MRLGLVAAVVGLGACLERSPVSLPQLESVSRAASEPREARTAAYQRCLGEALETRPPNQPLLLRCMETAGFGFLARPAYHRAAHCQAQLDKADELPEAFCFQKHD